MKNRLLLALTMKLGAPENRGGGEYEFECPRPGCKSDGKKKFGINIRRFKYNCWRCHSAGQLVDLLEELGIDRSMVVVRTVEKPKEKVPVPHKIPGFRPFNEAEYRSGDYGITVEAIMDMCRKRGHLMTDDLFELGWGFSTETWLSGRLIVPITVDGDLVQYLARAAQKYLEPKEKCGPEAQGWWPKPSVAYGLEGAPPGSDMVIVEGIWDWCAVRRMGSPWVPVASLGTSLGQYAIGSLLRAKPRSVTVLYDGDEAGREATSRVAQQLRKRKTPLLRVARMPDGKDPDDLNENDLLYVLTQATPFI